MKQDYTVFNEVIRFCARCGGALESRLLKPSEPELAVAPVAFPLLPRDRRADMHAVYAFCRHTDNLGDEGDAARRLAASLHRNAEVRLFERQYIVYTIANHRHIMAMAP